jgi:chromosome segregation ATPase
MSKEKTIHELAKEFPDKSYREMEIYREKDRQQEAGTCIIGEARKDREKSTEPEFLIETYEKEIWKLKELLSRALQDTNTLEGTKRIVIELSKEKITLKKRAQEAEGELSILKGIETNRVKEAQARCDHLSLELDRIKRDNVNLYSRIAELIEVDESHQKLNGKLQTRLTELEEENKKMHDHIKKQVDGARKSGM